MKEAIFQARKSLYEGGIPIGSVLVKEEKIIAKGHNKRVQENNSILHGEMDCLNNAGRIGSFKNTTIYSTLMPCYMCAGTIVQFNIPKFGTKILANYEGKTKKYYFLFAWSSLV